MLLKTDIAKAIATGRLSTVYRCWNRQRVQVGSTLRTVAGVLAAKLAAKHGVERAKFKARVRQLKERGLTESLEVGYRLSARGRALLRRLDPPGT